MLADWKWLHPIVVTFNTLCLVKCYIQWCGALQRTCRRSYLKQLICPCLGSQFSGKATKVGSPPNFPKLISQLWGIPQSQYFITLLLDPHWTYFWKHYLYHIKYTKVGSQNFGYQIWFCTRLLNKVYCWINSPLLRKEKSAANTKLLSKMIYCVLVNCFVSSKNMLNINE